MAEQETIVDIIAEMNRVEVCADEEPCLRDYADRLDAAHKRECGDCAKLREALKATLDLFWDIHNANRSPQSNQAYAVIRQIKAALAAPPRNCDRFGSSTQAMAEWYKTEVLPRVEGVVSGVEPPFVDWLFAPSTEKEGGTDGNE